MPKHVIDYSNTIFYKIYCKDERIKDLYIGHTTNFVQRKYGHKRACTNDKDANHNLKVYQCIRDNGGWHNWKMEIIGFRECYDHFEARKIEQSYFESLKATLNSIEPLPKPKPRNIVDTKDKKEKQIWNCDVCSITCQTEKQLVTHQKTNKHKRNLNNTQNPLKISKKYICETCDYNTSNLKDYNKHLFTKKHKMLTNVNEKIPENPQFICDLCNKVYKYRQSLHVHKRNCSSLKSDVPVEDNEPTIEYLLKENLEMKKDNLEMKKVIMEIIGKIGNTTNNITNNNQQNNFNINMFLNETCKDANDLSDFIGRIAVDVLENNA